MSTDPISALEYETMVFGRHLSSLPGHARRSTGVLDQSAYTLLNLLLVGGPQSIGELSAVTGLDASTLNRQTAALLRDDLAERIADPNGGVARKMRATAHGAELLHEERAASINALRNIMDDWKTADLDTFSDLLMRFNRAIEHRIGKDWPRPIASD